MHTIFLKDEKAKYFIKGFNDKLELKSNNFNSIKIQVVKFILKFPSHPKLCHSIIDNLRYHEKTTKNDI